MKKVLLGTTALFAVAMLPHAAFADDQPAKLSISGIYQFGYGVSVISQDKSTALPAGAPGYLESSNNLPDGAKVYGTIDISGDTTFKNGIGAGAFIELWGQTYQGSAGTSSSVRQDWIHLLSSSFGELRVGNYTDARRAKGLVAPSWSQNDLFGGNSPDVAFVGSGANSNTTTAWFGNRFMTEVAYFSPTFDGAQLSLSYAPDNGSFNSAGPAGGSTAFNSYDVGTTSIRDVLSGALSWSGTVGGFAISADAGATYGSAKKVATGLISNKPFVWDTGVTVGYGPWNVGAVYEQTSGLNGNYAGGGTTSLNSEEINKTGDVGVNYTVGNLTAGVEWSRGIYEGGVGSGGDPKAHYTLDTVTPGASYIIGPGVDVDAGVAFNATHDNASLLTYKGHDAVLEFGTEVKF